MELADLAAAQLVRMIENGEISSLELVEACIVRIDDREEDVGAWAHLDHDFAREQAERCNALHASGKLGSPLHGIPVGIKDIFDTDDFPTEYGTVIAAGHRPRKDCTAVSLLKAAGAVIMGKTVTTEFAVYAPGKTRNPHDLKRSPGGSSSGSAAAVAAGMVPLAIGSQTNGSVIRPASFCGIIGFKPTHGAISRHGMLTQSPPLDHVGVFARSIEDLAMIADCLTGYDDRDSAMTAMAARNFAALATSEPPVAPKFAFVKSPFWDRADKDTREGFAELVEELGESCEEVDLPPHFADGEKWHRTLLGADLAKNLASYYERSKDQLSDNLCAFIKEGQRVLAVDYNAAMDWQEVLNASLDDIFEEYDAILTPSTIGQAPPIETTGDPIFCTLWTLCGTPAVTLPLLQGADGLPIGVQLVGQRGDDARLLRTANWLARAISVDAT
jgi:Asp-tRNA(Asn)/Glu-tRNA(Gln) amidotransferase A subunit family amidase